MARILVIDDNLSVRNALCETLEDAGYSTVATCTGQRAREMHRLDPVDLVITDLFMPDTDGLEVIYQFRHEFPDVKILAVSGGGSRGLIEILSVAKKMGAHGSLMKPFGPDELLSAVSSLVGDPSLPPS